MKKNFQLILLLVFSAIVITVAVRAGEHHDDCRECEWVMRENSVKC